MKKNAARVSRSQESRLQEDARLEEVLPLIQRAKDAGITLGAIKEQIPGDAKSLSRLKAKLAALVGEGVIHGPVRYAPAPRKKKEDFYFATGHGPTRETVSARIVRFAQQRGARPPSAGDLKKEVTGIDGGFLKDAIKHAVESRAVLEIKCGASMFYVHRDVVLKHFGATGPAAGAGIGGKLTLEAILPAYRRLKAEQRGLSAVDIYDLMRTLGVPKDALHELLLKETKAGRVTIHRTTSVELAQEVLEAGIRLPGFADPFVTVVVKDEP